MSLAERCKAAKRAVTAKQLAVRLRSHLVNLRATSPSRTTGKIAYVHTCVWCGGEANLWDKDNGQVGLGCQGTGADGEKCRHDPVDLVAKLYAVDLPGACALLIAWGRTEGDPVPAAQATKPTTSPSTGPKVETWESPILGTPLGVRVFFGAPGAWAEAQGCLHVALCKDDWEFVQQHHRDLAKAPIVAVDHPALWTALKMLPAKLRGELYYRGKPSASHSAFVEHAATKGCTYQLFDLDRVERQADEADEDQDQDLPPVATERTPITPPRPAERTPQPPASPGATARTTPVDQGRPTRRDPAVAYADYASSVGPKAQALLRELLAAGPVAGRQVVLAARDRGISKGQVHAARDALGVVSLSPAATWCLPDRLPAA